MKPTPEEQNRAHELRRQAEEALRGQPVDLDHLPMEDIQQVIHELQVHQAELTMQNEELRRVQGELEAAQKRYADLYQFAPAGYCTLSRKGRILEANQTLSDLLGVEPGKLRQHDLAEYVEGADQDSYYLHRQRAFDSPERQVDVVRMLRSSGERIYVRLESVRAPGDETRIAMMLSDISTLKQQEKKLADTAAELARVNHEIQDFTFIASHDMQEPLRKIRTFSSLLMQGKAGAQLSDEGQDYLRRMDSAAIRLQTMLDGLLAYSRVTTKAQPYVNVNLFQLVTEVRADFDLRLYQTQGTVEVDELPAIEADPQQMRLLFHMLIDNALKFTQPGIPPQVNVSAVHLSADSANPEQVQILVQDHGIGFDTNQIDRLFQPFHRLVGRGAYEGAGIGLAIARKIVERHAGQITAQSTPGQGTTFIITLPVKQPAQETG